MGDGHNQPLVKLWLQTPRIGTGTCMGNHVGDLLAHLCDAVLVFRY